MVTRADTVTEIDSSSTLLGFKVKFPSTFAATRVKIVKQCPLAEVHELEAQQHLTS